MADLLDSEAGSERFASYEAELKLVQADLTQKLDQIPELSGEPRKAAISQAERALEEARELVSAQFQTPIADEDEEAAPAGSNPKPTKTNTTPSPRSTKCGSKSPTSRGQRRIKSTNGSGTYSTTSTT